MATAFNYCVVDGRPHVLNTRKNQKLAPLDIKLVFPTPTRPMCWVAQTQLEIFQGIMGGMINPSLSEQIALLKECYGAMRPREKSARRDSRYCARFRRMLGDGRSG